MAVTSYPIKKIAGGKGPFYDYEFKGLSTDTKPIKDIPVNSLFWELDTSKFYYCSQEAVEPVVERTVLLDSKLTEWYEQIEGVYASGGSALVHIPSSDMPQDKINVKVNGQEYILPKVDGLSVGTYGEVTNNLPSFENYPVCVLYSTSNLEVEDIMVYSPNANDMTITIYFETSQSGSNAVWTELGTAPTSSRELLFEGDVTTELVDGDVLYVFNPSVKMNYSSLIVEFDGTKYTVPNVANVGKPENLYFEFGAPYDFNDDQYVWVDYPFNLYYGPNDNDISQIFTESTGTYSLKIWANSDPIIPEENGGGDVVNI